MNAPGVTPIAAAPKTITRLARAALAAGVAPPPGLFKAEVPCNNAANVESPLAVITYEHPLNEKVRTFLRLEDMYDRVLLFTGRDAPRDHEVAFSRLFEILDAGSRSDVKSELLQELDRQRVMLEALRGNPEVASDRLDAVLQEVRGSASSLQSTQGKFGQHLRDNDWIMAIRSRFNIPGGACEFDLPGFHHWLHQPSYVRQGQLQAWLEPLLPIHRAIGTILRLLRESSADFDQVARRGSFQQMPMLRPAQMIRIQLEDGLACVPEISANKYALNIRFISNAAGLRPSLYEHDVAFKIAYCNL